MVAVLKNRLDENLVDVFNNGEKIYVLPKSLDKGSAIRRLRKYLGADFMISAGDSEFDVPMLEYADVGLIPSDFNWELGFLKNKILRNTSEKIFSDFVLEKTLEFLI